jgi:hypothetical protein
LGGQATGATDSGTGLNWKDATGSWNDWVSGACWDNTITNWQGTMPTSTSFESGLRPGRDSFGRGLSGHDDAAVSEHE